MKNCQIVPSFSTEITNIITTTFDLKLLSIKDLITNEIRVKNQTELGKNINNQLKSGNLIPTNLIIDLIGENLKTNKKGILIVGFPRTIEHIIELNKLLKENDYKINLIWLLKIKNSEKFISEVERKKLIAIEKRNKVIIKEINDAKIVELEYKFPLNKMEITQIIKTMHNNQYKQ